MNTTLVLTFIAEDRPGLVGKLSEVVTAQGGNWLESRMAHLAEKFAGIARVEIPTDKVTALQTALEALEAEGFHLTVEETASGAQPNGNILALDLVGPDQPGIVRDITRCLADRGVSVEEMETGVREAPMGGGTLFHGRARVRVPVGLDPESLRDALESLAGALMVDITLRETSSDNE